MFALLLGGAMKHIKYACYCCNIHRDNILTPNILRCEDCVRLGVTTPCYHQAISDEQLMIRLSEEHAELQRQWPHLAAFPIRGSRIIGAAQRVWLTTAVTHGILSTNTAQEAH